MPHSHEIDGQLHDDCPACELIEEVTERAKREKAADANADRYARVAGRSKR